MKEVTENQKINPQVTTIEIGVRNLRSITIYPLSLGDQLEMSDIISNTLGSFFQLEDQSEMALASFVLELIQSNLEKIIGLVIEEDEDVKKIMKELSNVQTVGVSTLIFEMNYEAASKNVRSLFKKVKSTFLSERPSPQSVSDTDTNSKTSTESPLKEEE
ncbi:hypothetical protein LCGC14_1083020 [marine sediment metagenome]|uniref:Uncharacterized protein n=1 Tax=marine sediment metagenome TaxID=412755 RepID=A0A0F9QKN6_9ZZZZ|nr:hypothetical protein [Pricia sp.]